MSSEDLLLPPEIWHQILSKLPVKSILRSRCVCRTWYSLIASPNFVSDHIAQTLNQSTGNRVLVHRRENQFDSMTSNLSFHDDSFVESHQHHNVPELLRSPGVQIVGSCNGLICFSGDYHRQTSGGTYEPIHSFLIWNPSIGKSAELPFRYSPFSQFLFGFGFDSESRDYKVVRVVYNTTYGSDVVVAESDIFDLKKGVWRSSSFPMPSCYFRPFSVYLYGNLHWIGNDDTFTNYTLVCFNLSSEVLHRVEMVPDAAVMVEDDDCIRSYTDVVPINGLLSLAVVKEKKLGGFHQYCISVWSMKEYGVTESWSKLFNIELPYPTDLLSLQRFWENGEVLLVERVVKNERDRDVLVLYNPKSGESKTLLSTDEHIRKVCFYKESLVLL